MKTLRPLQQALAFVALVGCCLPQVAFPAPPTPKPPISDVKLQEGDMLVGQVVTPQIIGVANLDVTLLNADQKLAVTRSDEQGRFAFRGLQNGVYQLGIKQSQASYRVWTKDTAPPAAQQGAMLVVDKDTILGQSDIGGGGIIRGLLNRPILLAGIVAAAVAIPVAIHNANKHKGPSSP